MNLTTFSLLFVWLLGCLFESHFEFNRNSRTRHVINNCLFLFVAAVSSFSPTLLFFALLLASCLTHSHSTPNWISFTFLLTSDVRLCCTLRVQNHRSKVSWILNLYSSKQPSIILCIHNSQFTWNVLSLFSPNLFHRISHSTFNFMLCIFFENKKRFRELIRRRPSTTTTMVDGMNIDGFWECVLIRILYFIAVPKTTTTSKWSFHSMHAAITRVIIIRIWKLEYCGFWSLSSLPCHITRIGFMHLKLPRSCRGSLAAMQCFAFVSFFSRCCFIFQASANTWTSCPLIRESRVCWRQSVASTKYFFFFSRFVLVFFLSFFLWTLLLCL
jgi:hypothetical protein